MIEELSEDARLLAKSKNITVKLTNCDPVSINGDATRLKQLFLNLIDNTIKYTPTHGKVYLSLEREDGAAVISVRDTGIGINRKLQEKIFDRFYRVGRGHNGAVPGSGLGLSIAKWIAEAHHGNIQVKSREKKGSTFVVKLPVSFPSAS